MRRWSTWWSGRRAITACPRWRRGCAPATAPSTPSFPQEDKFDRLPQGRRARGPAAFLTVQEGCDKFCAFCVVPYTRGAEVSRPADRVMAEARALVAAGVREVTLLGQNVNAYRAEAGGGRKTGRWRA